MKSLLGFIFVILFGSIKQGEIKIWGMMWEENVLYWLTFGLIAKLGYLRSEAKSVQKYTF